VPPSEQDGDITDKQKVRYFEPNMRARSATVPCTPGLHPGSDSHIFVQTISALVDAANEPVSVIIVGVGDEDFEEMEVLDGDDVGLVDENGRWARGWGN
jgi:hypothetical protein